LFTWLRALTSKWDMKAHEDAVLKIKH